MKIQVTIIAGFGVKIDLTLLPTVAELWHRKNLENNIMWKYCRTEFTPYWWVIPFGVRVEDCLYRTDIEKELDIYFVLAF